MPSVSIFFRKVAYPLLEQSILESQRCSYSPAPTIKMTDCPGRGPSAPFFLIINKGKEIPEILPLIQVLWHLVFRSSWAISAGSVIECSETSRAAATLALSLDPWASLMNPAYAVFGGIVSVWLFLGQGAELCSLVEQVQRDYRMFSVSQWKQDNESHSEKSGRKEIKVARWGAGRLLWAD